MIRPRPAVTFFMSLLALSTGFTTIIRPQSCVRMSPLWIHSRHQFMHRKPCSVTYFQVDDTALEFEDAETPVSEYFDKLKSMVYFLWSRSAVALLHASQRAPIPSSEDVSADVITLINLNGKKQEVAKEDTPKVKKEDELELEGMKRTEKIPDAKDNPVIVKDEVSAGMKSSENDEVVLISKDLPIVPEMNDLTEPTVVKKVQVTADSERSSTMHRREGDRVVGLKDEFLDPLSEATSLGFGRPLEVIEAGVPPLREEANPAASSK